MDELVELGRTAGAYGFRGWVRIQLVSSGDVLRKVHRWVLVPIAGEARELTIEAVRPHGNGLIAKWQGCDNKEVAETFRGTIYVHREDFPDAGKDEVYAVDLIGAHVVNRAGTLLGQIVRVSSNGVQDLFEVEYSKADGKKAQFMIPIVKDVYLISIDTDSDPHTVTVDWDPEWR